MDGRVPCALLQLLHQIGGGNNNHVFLCVVRQEESEEDSNTKLDCTTTFPDAGCCCLSFLSSSVKRTGNRVRKMCFHRTTRLLWRRQAQQTEFAPFTGAGDRGTHVRNTGAFQGCEAPPTGGARPPQLFNDASPSEGHESVQGSAMCMYVVGDNKNIA